MRRRKQARGGSRDGPSGEKVVSFAACGARGVPVLPLLEEKMRTGGKECPRLLLFFRSLAGGAIFLYYWNMQIYTLGHEVLRQKALPVQDINDEIAALVKEMRETMYAGRGIGLAGPQVGLLQRIFVVHIEGDIPRVFINPSIIQTSPELTEYEEGCLSIPGLYGEVKRPEAVRIQAWNERGRPFTLDAEGLLARVIQHEYDHLEGVLFIDRLSEPKRKKLLALYDKKLRA